MSRHDLSVGREQVTWALAKILARSIADLSFEDAEALVTAGGVFVDGKRHRVPSKRVALGARVVAHVGVTVEAPSDLRIIYEDERVVVVDKQPGLHLNETETSPQQSLIELVQVRCAEARVVHRLDRDTSGVVAVAKDRDTAAELSAAFADRSVHKRYLAICEGAPDDGIIEARIGLDARRRRARRVRADGKAAVSEVTVLGQADGLAGVAVHPTTGRTHQIRVHLAHVGCPIVGDRLYGGPEAVRRGAETLRIHRVLLHAVSLTLPLGGAERTFEAPLPDDMAAFTGLGLALDVANA